MVVGKHWIIELEDCPAERLDNPDLLRGAIERACEVTGLHLLQAIEHSFTPQGVTALGLLSESHISIHTWPEHGYAAVDIFTCGNHDLDSALKVLVDEIGAMKHTFRVIERGMGRDE